MSVTFERLNKTVIGSDQLSVVSGVEWLTTIVRVFFGFLADKLVIRVLNFTLTPRVKRYVQKNESMTAEKCKGDSFKL